MDRYNLKFKWTVSKARDSYGYNVCTLLVNGKKVSRCNGGGYDMKGTVLGTWVAREFEKQLVKLTIPMNTRNGEEIQEYYGLSFHNLNFNPSTVKIEGQTIEEREKEGKSLGLERYQAFYKVSSKIPTKEHIIPLIDGACGVSSVEKILKGLDYKMTCIDYDSGVYIVEPVKER